MVDYKGKLVLAPMVRIGELPTRLLALRHGCDLVWGPEIIDKKLLQCERIENENLKTIDFLSTKNVVTKIPGVTNLVFRTYPTLEKDKLIFQMGSSNADLAVQAAKLVIGDVSGIDLNAGCPKHFSIHSGMGAALLSTPDLLCDILCRLVKEVGEPNGKPISVKIRLLPTEEETLALVDKILETGISNLTLHCRTKTMRNRESPIRDLIPQILDRCRAKKITFIINGDIKDRKEFDQLQKTYGTDLGCMIASAAEINPTCFSHTGSPLAWFKTIKEFIAICGQFNNWKGNTKYCLTRMVPAGESKHTKRIYQEIARAKEHDQLASLVNEHINDKGEYVEVPSSSSTTATTITEKKRPAAAIEEEEAKNDQTLKKQRQQDIAV